MKKKILLYIFLVATWNSSVFAQEQFEKKINVHFDHVRMDSAINVLLNTQSNLEWMIFGPSIKTVFITVDLDGVTFDHAIKKILKQQSVYRDYCITDYGNYRDFQLFQKKLDANYFNRNKQSKFYHVGDRLPDYVYTITNYAAKTLKLSSLKKKLIILDLWGIHCTGCIESMPHMQQLQDQFKDKVQIISVTKDSKEMVDLLKARAAIVRDCTLPLITGENMLPYLFDYVSVPRQIWIDSTGKVVYNTSKEIASEKYINEYLLGKRMNLHEAKDTDIADDEPIASSLNFIHHGDFAISSYLAAHDESKYSYESFIGGQDIIKDHDSVKVIRICPVDIYKLYKMAYEANDPNSFSTNRIFREFKDPGKYDPDYVLDKNTYDYELLTKDKNITAAAFYTVMQQEIDAYFHLKSSWEKRPVTCYILQRIDEKNRFKPKGKSTGLEYSAFNGWIMSDYNTYVGLLVYNINSYRSDKAQLLNETGLSNEFLGNCKLDLDFENDLPAANKTLAALGLVIVKESREMGCIVLKDATNILTDENNK